MSRAQASATATDHAELRWVQRAGVDAPPLHAALEEAVSVGLPDHAGSGWLHPPTDTVLVVRSDGRLEGAGIATVLDASQSTLTVNDDHLVVCEGCNQRFHPGGGGDCPWCTEVDDA